MKNSLIKGSLALYRKRPALVRQVGKKIEIQVGDEKGIWVRAKDLILLHPGPLTSLTDLHPEAGEIETAWELVTGQTSNLQDLAELVYGKNTPSTIWATWKIVEDGLYFSGEPAEIKAHTPAEVENERSARAARQAEEAAWLDFLTRVEKGQFGPDDNRFLQDVVMLALEKRTSSQVLRSLGKIETSENAHAFLLSNKYWDESVNPYPQRLQVSTNSPDISVPAHPTGPRMDLTDLPAFAIDDAGNQDPDDALSYTEGTLWVHIADPASFIEPDSQIDMEARGRGSTLYLPEGAATMLPSHMISTLGLGLQTESLALTIRIDLSDENEISQVAFIPSLISVTRLTYAQADECLDQEPFASMNRLAQEHHKKRQERGAIEIELPEVKVKVIDGQVTVKPILPTQSRLLVSEAMLLAGEATARFVLENEIPCPFTTQPVPETTKGPDGLAGMFSLRRSMRPSQYSTVPAVHGGLGLKQYVQATSPLRRYLDLVVHQQLHAFLSERSLLSDGEILERVGAISAVAGNIRQAERLSRLHWTLVYLIQHPQWTGEGILVEAMHSRGRLLIPELDLETWVHMKKMIPLNSSVRVSVSRIDLPSLEASFRTEGI